MVCTFRGKSSWKEKSMNVGNINSVASFTGTSAKAVAETAKVVTENFGPEVETFIRRKELQKKLLESMPKSMKLIDKLNALSGEVPNILINAVGTAFVAPIFIKYNFLSKTDEDVRTYSAFRQPISAVLAVLTQAGLVIPFDRILDKFSNTGSFTGTGYNKTMFQDPGSLKRTLQKEYQKAHNGAKMSEDALKKAVLDHQKNQIEEMAKSLKENNTISYTVRGKTKQMTHEEMKDILNSTCDGLISDAKNNIERYSKEKIHMKVKRGNYYRTNGETALEEIDSIEKLINEGKDYKTISSSIKKRIKELTKSKADKELIETLKDISCKPDVKTISAHLEKNRDAIKQYQKLTSYEEVFSDVSRQVSQDIGRAEKELSLLKQVKGELSTCEKINIKGIIKTLNPSGSQEQEGIDILFETIQKITKNAEKNIKAFKQVTGLVVSLAILPLTCTMLNYLYPKIMDAVFPNLSKAKKDKSPDKFVKSNSTEAVAQSIDATTSKQEVSK